MKVKKFGVVICVILSVLMMVSAYANPELDNPQEPEEPENPYSIEYKDVRPGDWYYDSVKYVSYKKYMIGTDNNVFSPNKEVTRAEAAQVLYAMAKCPKVDTSRRFKDVPIEAWYSMAVTYAAENQIVAGYPDQTFRPNNTITREEFITMLLAYAKFEGKDVSKKGNITTFSDANDISRYSRDSMQWAVGNGLVVGTDSGIHPKIEPKAKITRAQLAKIVDAYHFNTNDNKYLDVNDPTVFSELMDEAAFSDGAYAEKVASQLHYLKDKNPKLFDDELSKKDDKTKDAVRILLKMVVPDA